MMPIPKFDKCRRIPADNQDILTGIEVFKTVMISY